MSQDTNVENLIINKLTKAQYESITNPDPTQLYFITDEGESISTLDDVSLNNIANGQILKYNATTQKWENAEAAAAAVWGNITGTLSDQTDLQTALNGKQATLVSGTNIKTINNTSLLGSGNISVPTSISDLTDDTNTNPIDKADTLTGLTASVAELNYTDGVTSNIQTQLNGKADVTLSNVSSIDNNSAVRTALDTKVNSSDIWYDNTTSTLYIGVAQS